MIKHKAENKIRVLFLPNFGLSIIYKLMKMEGVSPRIAIRRVE
jgi:hypothetical protein